MKQDQRTIEQIAGFVTIHVALPPHLMKWAAKHAKNQGHSDIQTVIREAIDLLIARHKAGSPLA
jgi:hypothetical protein